MGNNVYTFAHTNYYKGRLKKENHFWVSCPHVDNQNYFHLNTKEIQVSRSMRLENIWWVTQWFIRKCVPIMVDNQMSYILLDSIHESLQTNLDKKMQWFSPLWWYYYAHPENMYLGQTAILTFILSRSNPWHCLQT